MNKENNFSTKEFAKSQFSLGRWLVEQKRYLEAEQVFQEIIREDDRQLFVKSRFNLALLLIERKKYFEAEQAYQEIKREDDKQLFAKSRFNLALLLIEQKKYLEAEQAYQEIEREDDKQVFAKSRFYLGLLLEKQEKYEGAEQAYQEIKREDDKKQFAMSRFNLGLLLEKQEKYEGAELAYQEIKREDDKKQFAMSRFNLGLLLGAQEKYDRAEQAYQEIEREDDKQLFAESRFNLGGVLETQKKYLEAEQAYKSIKREDDKKQFAMSRVNLGVLFELQGKYLEAEKACQEIERKDNKQIFAMSRFNLGLLFETQRKYLEAELAYKSVERKDDKEQFAKSRNNLGALLVNQGKNKKAEKIFRTVTVSDSPEIFALICMNLGFMLKQDNKLVEAKEVLEKITENDGEYFFSAKFTIGEIYLEEGKYDKAKIAFEKSKEHYYYESERSILISELSSDELAKSLIKIKEFVDVILNYLKLDSEHEEYICHYTRPSTAFSLLGYGGEASKLRLSTIRNVNDPTEGNILFDYFKLPNKEIEPSSFISCFTFNYDSLNHFRLYGKENNQEASGVSIIFNKDFFNEYSNLCNFIEYGRKGRGIKFPHLDRNLNIDGAFDDKINKLPVYRCIYMDDKSDYIKLASRSEIDFYREGKSEFFTSYLDNINKKTKNVKSAIEEIKTILNGIFENDNSNEALYTVINYILLPLKFLVKHAAFEDERECRIFFITDLFDERIISDVNNKSMYLEYEPSVREHVKEIYLSIGASQYEDFFIRALKDSSKVCHSQNPFRNK